MAALELEGKILHKLPAQSGQSARGNWARQDFVVEYPDGNFNSQALFSAWGEDKVNDLARFNEGDSVKVSFNVRAREYNGKWFNDLRVWRLTRPGQQAPAAGAPAPAASQAPVYQDVPAQAASQAPYLAAPGYQSAQADPGFQQVPPPTFDDLPAADPAEDDLPF